MPARSPVKAYYHPREIRRIKVKRGAAAIKLRRRLQRFEAERANEVRTPAREELYQRLVAAMKAGIAEADRKAARIDARLGRDVKNC